MQPAKWLCCDRFSSKSAHICCWDIRTQSSSCKFNLFCAGFALSREVPGHSKLMTNKQLPKMGIMRSICDKLLTLWKWKWKRDTCNSGDIPFLDCSLLKSWEGMHAKDNKGYLPANSKMDTENWWCGDVHFKGPDGFRSWIRNFRRFHGCTSGLNHVFHFKWWIDVAVAKGFNISNLLKYCHH